MAKREDGFYWVNHDGAWTIAEFRDFYWMISGVGMLKLDSMLLEIDERRIVREA